MYKHFIAAALLCAGWAGSAQGQSIPSYGSEDVLKRVAGPDTLYIVNFWATWCVPCVKELPAFASIDKMYSGAPVKVILLSFDFKEQYPEQLEAWVQKRGLSTEVAWFNETNPTQYIPKIAPDWEGALPATLLIDNRTGEKTLLQEPVDADRLKQWIDQRLKHK